MEKETKDTIKGLKSEIEQLEYRINFLGNIIYNIDTSLKMIVDKLKLLSSLSKN